MTDKFVDKQNAFGARGFELSISGEDYYRVHIFCRKKVKCVPNRYEVFEILMQRILERMLSVKNHLCPFWFQGVSENPTSEMFRLYYKDSIA